MIQTAKGRERIANETRLQNQLVVPQGIVLSPDLLL